MTLLDDSALLPTKQVRERYGCVSHMWIERRLADDPAFPKPVYIAKRRYFRLAELVAWERIRAANPQRAQVRA